MPPGGGPAGGLPVPLNNFRDEDSHTYVYRVNWDRVVSSNLLNRVTFGHNNWWQIRAAFNRDQGWGSRIGLKNVPGPDLLFPLIDFSHDYLDWGRSEWGGSGNYLWAIRATPSRRSCSARCSSPRSPRCATCRIAGGTTRRRRARLCLGLSADRAPRLRPAALRRRQPHHGARLHGLARADARRPLRPPRGSVVGSGQVQYPSGRRHRAAPGAQGRRADRRVRTRRCGTRTSAAPGS